jgi:hypothetical protein
MIVLIENSRLLFTSATSDTSKRKLVKDAHLQSVSGSLVSPSFHNHHSLRPVTKESKPALPSGLRPDASISYANVTTQLVKSTKVPTVINSTPADDANFSSRYDGILDSDLAE